MQTGKRILLLGVYGMEMVECGGVLCKNAQMGGACHAAFFFAGPQMREGLKKAAEILGCTTEYLDFDMGTIHSGAEERLKVAQVIRRFRPDVIITQDPEHCIQDLDPGRRPAMTVLLEGMALAGRDYQVTEDGAPWRKFSVYYMTPSSPNCLVDISDVWDQKCRAMDALDSQLAFIGQLVRGDTTPYEKLIPDFGDLKGDLEIGRSVKRLWDLSYHLYHGSTGHNSVFLSENYRKDSMFCLDMLL